MGMKNKHLEHPEDSIFTSGRKGLHTILNFLQEKKSDITVKYDGCPAIVWGVNCLLYTSPSPRDAHESRMPSSA